MSAKGQTFGVSQISISPSGLKADEYIIPTCAFPDTAEVTIVEESQATEFGTHGCGTTEEREKFKKVTVTCSLVRDYSVLKNIFPDHVVDGAQAGEYDLANTANLLNPKMSLKIRPLGATDDADATLYYSVIASFARNTTATAEGVDMVDVTFKVSGKGLDDTKLAVIESYGIDFPAA